ncbi:hypothetical protein ABZ915_24235 [Streptomyces sp. NPDC046915]|uniref:hypothetical protein n=1 Tax=Streptomyces sp. NPDC046915 TaxID=3155257 RepID=UPI0033C172EC
MSPGAGHLGGGDVLLQVATALGPGDGDRTLGPVQFPQGFVHPVLFDAALEE